MTASERFGCTEGARAVLEMHDLVPLDAKILVPVDFSPLARAAVDTALLLAGDRPDVTIELVHVVDEEASSPEKLRFARSELSRLVGAESCAARLIGTVLTGNPAETLRHTSLMGGYALVILTSHGRTGLASIRMGSVAEELVHDALVSVLVLKPKLDQRGCLEPVVPKFKHLIVGYDGSGAAQWALRVARDVAKRFDSRITLVHAVEEDRVAAAAAELHEACAEHLPESSAWKTVVGTGSPCEVLSRVAKDMGGDTVIVGPHKHTRWGHCFCDSSAGEVIRMAGCAVLAAH